LTVNKPVTHSPKQAKYSKNALYIKDTFFFSTERVYSIEKKKGVFVTPFNSAYFFLLLGFSL